MGYIGKIEWVLIEVGLESKVGKLKILCGR